MAESDDENIPLATLKRTINEDEIPLARLGKRRLVVENIQSSSEEAIHDSDSQSANDDESVYDSDGDPVFSPGVCEVRRCKEEVWSACPDCEILVCYDHCNEEISSCDQHGTMGQAKRRKRTRKVNKEKVQLKENASEGPRHSEPPQSITEATCGLEERPEQFMVEGSAKEVVMTKDKKSNKQKVAKDLRNRGEEYTSVNTKKKVPARHLKPRCNGSIKCGKKCDTITDEQRQEIFKAFYNLADLRLQREFIVRHIEISGVQRSRNKADNQSRRQSTKKYFLTNYDQQLVHVCKVFFVNTLCISEQSTRTALSKICPSGTLEKEKRGGKSDKIVERDRMIRQSVTAHIDRFPRVESHFCRSSSSREYLHSDLTLQKMYSMFSKEWSQKSNPPSFSLYRKVFNEKNVSFHLPKKDQCSLCMTFKSSKDEAAKERLKDKYDRHIAEKEMVRELKDSSKKEAQEKPDVVCATFDLQQVIYLPKSLESALFYKRRLSNYNLTIYDLGDKNCHCFTWHEGESKRGSSEISTAVYKALQSYDENGVREVNLFSDGCSGQNKNSIMPAMMLYTVMNSKYIENISLRFFESFHGQNEGDSAHSAISYAMKKAGDLFIPSQLIPIFSLARREKPYITHQLQFDDFLDFKTLSKDLRILDARRESEEGTSIAWNSIMELKVYKSYPDKIFFKTSHLEEKFNEIQLKRLKPNYLKQYNLKNLNTEQNKISKEKFEDLISLCFGDIPIIRIQEHKQFYLSLPHE